MVIGESKDQVASFGLRVCNAGPRSWTGDDEGSNRH